MNIIAHTDIFWYIKNRVAMIEVFQRYTDGELKQVGRRMKGRCVFHQENTPSFDVDTERQTFICWGCQRRGDIFDFVGQLFGLEPLAAARRIAEDFGLDDVGRAQSQRPTVSTKHLEDRAITKALELWRQKKHASLSTIYRVAHLAWKHGGPDAVPETVVHWLPQIPDILDLLERGDKDEIMMLWRKKDDWTFLAG